MPGDSRKVFLYGGSMIGLTYDVCDLRALQILSQQTSRSWKAIWFRCCLLLKALWMLMREVLLHWGLELHWTWQL